jgi:histidine phosphotransferase ChpT
MPDLVDMRVIGMLCSHLCHELVNPLGAVNNGIELLLDLGDDMQDDALSLIESSAQRATRRVEFYRMAYGTAGISGVGDLATARELADGMLMEGRLSLEWPDGNRNPTLPPGWGRLLLNLAAAAAEALPRGGVLTMTVDDTGGAAHLCAVAKGDRAQLEDSVRAVFFSDVPVEELTRKGIHSYYTVKLAESLGGRIEVSEGDEEEVRFDVRPA